MKFDIKLDSAIAAMEKNLSDHVKELTEANEGWTHQVIDALEKFRDAVNRQGLKASHDALYKLMYSRPVDNRSLYSKYLSALKRAKADGQELISVDEEDHDHIYNDNWEWRVASKSSNTAYTRK